jgi:capsular polysaccharide transport system permease protein
MPVIEHALPQSRDLRLREVENQRPEYAEYLPSKGGLLKRLFALGQKHLLFIICFVLPVSVVSCYYLFVAADMYVSEARFVVRSSSISPRLGGTNANLGQVTTLVRTNDDTQSVNAYISSRDALNRLIEENGFLEMVRRPEADFLSRFPRLWSKSDRESLFERLSEFVDPSFDSGTGVSTLRVRAFRPDDARAIALVLLSHAEELVNKLNGRARGDAISFAEEVVHRSEARVKEAQERIAAFRNREALFDPVRQAAAALDLIGKIAGEVAELKATLAELHANSPDSPRVEAVRSRIQALEDQISEQRSLIAGGDHSLAPKLAEYEKLVLERDLATKSFVSGLVSLENAREEGHRKQLYLERIVEPSLPDQSRYPHRLLSILYAAGVCLGLYWILTVLISTVFDHEL